jgi:hypothetical protein
MGKEKIYYLFVVITLFYLIWKNKHNALSILVITIFYSGLANYQGKLLENPYKMLIVVLSFYILIKFKALSVMRSSEKILLFVFILFSFSFILSGFLNHDSPNLLFSQYGKYIAPVCLYFILNHFINKSPEDLPYYKELFFSLLTIQIILSFVKWMTIGIQEWTVGSIVYIGGGEATPLPVLGFILVWLHTKGELKRKDWIFVVLLLVIGFVSLKRAIWFIMPTFILLFTYYVPRKVNLKKIVYFAPFIPLIFYLGVRFNPTLNKEGKFGGSFDIKFVIDYVAYYNFGKTESTKAVKLGTGRGGATLLIWDKFLHNKSLTFNDYFGSGLDKMYTTDYDTFDKYNFGLNSKGAATGIFQTYVTSGFIGIIFTILFILAIINLIKIPRIKITIGIFLFYDYLFYNGLIMRTSALFVLLFFIIICANQLSSNTTNTTNAITPH